MSCFITREFYQEEIIFNEGSTGNVAYILTCGSVEIATRIGNKNVVLAILEPIAVFGEMALLMSERKRTATAKALKFSEVVEVSKETFDNYLKESPKFINAVLNTLVNRLKRTTEKASKTPNLFMAICEILNLFLIHGQLELRYDRTVEMMSRTLVVDIPHIEEQLGVLKAFNFIDIAALGGGRKMAIHLLKKEGFLKEAKKVYQEISGFRIRTADR